MEKALEKVDKLIQHHEEIERKVSELYLKEQRFLSELNALRQYLSEQSSLSR